MRGVERGGEAEGDAGLARRPGPRASAGRSSRMPSASSTSAEPAWDEAERLPCLTTGTPAPAATIAAIVEMFTDIERSPPVPTTSSTRPLHHERRRVLVHRRDQALELVDGLALGPQRHREAGDLHRGGRAGEDLAHRPGGLVRGEVAAADQRREHLGPRVGCGHRDLLAGRTSISGPTRPAGSSQRVAGTRGESRCATASASCSGSRGCGTAPSARDQVASQASCGRPVSTRIGGQW